MFGFTIRIRDAFVWPALNQTVTLNVEGVDRLSAGTLLWNSAGGYLQVQNFDFTNQQVIAKNTGISCNTYQGGETLDAMTDFVVGPPVCPGSNTPLPNAPYLAADFTGPANGNCQVTALTNVAGLAINDIVSLNNYQYRVGSVIDSETVSLCNDGEGAPVGTVIRWDTNNDGIPDTPLIKISAENPCVRTGINSGVILVCDGSSPSLTKPLVGGFDGQFPVWNTAAQKFLLKHYPGNLDSCEFLTQSLTVDPAHVGSYVILIPDTTGILANQILNIQDAQYIVVSNDSSTQLHVVPVATPGSVYTYPIGTPVCGNGNATEDDNCAILTQGFTAGTSTGPYVIHVNTTHPFAANQIVTMFGIQWVVNSVVDAFTISLNEVVALGGPLAIPTGTYLCVAFAGEQQSIIAPTTTILDTLTYNSAGHSYTFKNTSDRKPLHVRIRTDFFFSGVSSQGNTSPTNTLPKILDNINGSGINEAASIKPYVNFAALATEVFLGFERLLHLPAGAMATYVAQGTITASAASGTPSILAAQITLKTTFLITQP